MADTTHGLRYTTTHEWARSEGGDLVTVGITDIGRQALGKVVYIEFPVVGRRVNRGEPCAVVETSKSVCDICSPVSGQVLLVNERLSEDCALLGYDAYEAWLFQLRVTNAGELEQLLDAAAYRALTAG